MVNRLFKIIDISSKEKGISKFLLKKYIITISYGKNDKLY